MQNIGFSIKKKRDKSRLALYKVSCDFKFSKKTSPYPAPETCAEAYITFQKDCFSQRHDLVPNLKHSINPTEISGTVSMPIYVAESRSTQPHIQPVPNRFAELELLSKICKYE